MFYKYLTSESQKAEETEGDGDDRPWEGHHDEVLRPHAAQSAGKQPRPLHLDGTRGTAN